MVFAKAIKEASEVHEGWLVIRMQLLNAMVDADDGRTQEAMDQLHNVPPTLHWILAHRRYLFCLAGLRVQALRVSPLRDERACLKKQNLRDNQ